MSNNNNNGNNVQIDKVSENIVQLSRVIRNNNFNLRRLLQTQAGANGSYIGYYSSSGITWDDASTYCRSIGVGYELASVHDDTSASEAYHACGSSACTNAWVGLNDVASEGNWEWSDGSAYDYEIWPDTEPNGGTNENCVHFRTTFDWNDLPCTSTRNNFVCGLAFEEVETDGQYVGLKTVWTVDWDGAETFCENHYGTNLASVHSSSQNTQAHNTVYTTYGNVRIWIGLNDVTTDGSWEWTDSTSYDYDLWNTGEPNGGTSENCVHFTTTGGAWNDLSCTNRESYFVCEVTTPSPTDMPTDKPTTSPTNRPTSSPTDRPSASPTSQPSKMPTNMPSKDPTRIPSKQPSTIPTRMPSTIPTTFPTNEPTIGYDRYFQIVDNYDGCSIDAGWFVISQGNQCGSQWIPGEGESVPQIRYSTNNMSLGLFSQANANAIAGLCKS